jgi:hypothetical protein
MVMGGMPVAVGSFIIIYLLVLFLSSRSVGGEGDFADAVL